MRRRRCSGRGMSRVRPLIYLGSASSTGCDSPLISLPSISVVYCGSSVLSGSATRTAPPWIRATPATAAESFAAASLSDIIPDLALPRQLDTARSPYRHQFQRFHELAKGEGAMRLTTIHAGRAPGSTQIGHVSGALSRFDTARAAQVSCLVSEMTCESRLSINRRTADPARSNAAEPCRDVPIRHR